jgi:hypothetical protein
VPENWFGLSEDWKQTKWRNCCGYELGGDSQHVNEAVVNAMIKSAYGKTESTHELKTHRKAKNQGEMRNRHRM